MTVKQILVYVALAGWVIALSAHVGSIAGMDVAEVFPFVWLLHIGLFVVWIPVVIDLRNNKELEAFRQSGIRNQLKPGRFFKITCKDTPNWIGIAIAVMFVYTVINFTLFATFATGQYGTPSVEHGEYMLKNHGKFIRAITEQEYHYYNARELRFFSGHWLLFYGMAAAMLYKHRSLTPQTETH